MKKAKFLLVAIAINHFRSIYNVRDKDYHYPMIFYPENPVCKMS